MKWLVKTLDFLLPYANEDEANSEQRSLESLIARYKNLIPTIEITMVKTEIFSKCYTYRREVHEVVCLLNKVKEQTINAPAPDSLERVNKMIQEQQYAINQLDHQRTHIMSMLQRGRDLSKDVHAPAFVSLEVKSLETGWNEAYSETVDKLKSLKGTQSVWNEFQDQKMEILGLLGTAESELRSITPLQTDPKNVSSDLKHKRELNVALQQASRQMISRLHDLCNEVAVQADPAKRPVLEKEVTEIEKQFFNTMEHVKDRVGYLEDYSAKWNSYKARLAELQAWAMQAAPLMIETIQSQDLSPEERVAKANTLQRLLTEKMKQLDMLGSDASELAPKEGNISEAKRLKSEVHKLQEMLSAINRNVEHRATAVKEDLINWQKYQAEIQEIKPWIEQSEIKVNYITSKPVSLQEAIKLQQQAKQFESQSENQLDKIHGIASISNQMTCKTNAPDELDAVQSRWASIHENAHQVTNKYDRLVAGWQSFDNDANKLEEWLIDNDKAISKRPVINNTPHVDKLEKELVKLKSFNNEISEQQAKLVALTQGSDQIALNLAPEGGVALKERVNAMKGKITKLSEALRAKINDVSDAIMARQDFNAQMATFSNWMDQIRGQAIHIEEINTEKVEPSLQMVLALLQEHSDKEPSFNVIHEEIKAMSQNASPEELLVINDSYAVLVANYQDIQSDLKKKQIALEKWNELLSWRNETESHVNHIKHQLDKPDKLGMNTLATILEEIEDEAQKLDYWRDEARLIDENPVIHLKETTTRKPMNAIQLVNELSNKLETLKLKSQSQMNVLNKMEERKLKFNELENQLVTHLTQNKQKLENILQVKPNFANIDQIIADLITLNDGIQKQRILKDKITDEGALLMKDDISSMPAIQESILVLEKEWDTLQQDINDRIQKYSIINLALKDYAEAKDKYQKEIKKAHDMYAIISSTPVVGQDLLQVADKTKKALDQVKKSKGNLDELEKKGNIILKLFDVIDNVPNDIATEMEECHRDWQNLYEQISKNTHLYETEAIIWNQIEESKNDLVPWLSETNQSLCDAADNTIEIEYGPIRLNKYKSELPSYLGIKQDIIEKINELQKMNKGVPIQSLESLKIQLKEQFQTLEQNAQRLQSVASTFDDQEKDLRKTIKTSGEIVTKLREQLIKCDDMSGDNNKIMERLQKCKSLKEQLMDSGSDIDNLKIRVDEMQSMYPTFAESIVPKELNNVAKRHEGVFLHANKIEGMLLQFLKKYHNDKIGMLQRMIATQKEKIAWCMPEQSSDKYNLEVKKSALNDIQKSLVECDNRKTEVANSLDMLGQIDSPENLSIFNADINKISKDLDGLQSTYVKTKSVLDNNIDLWNKYESTSENVTSWLKDIENKIKSEVTQFDLNKIDDKINDIKIYEQQIKDYKPTINELDKISKALIDKNSEVRVAQFVGHLTSRYQGVVKNIANLSDRANKVKDTFDVYNNSTENCKEWINDARIQFNELARMGSPGSGPTTEQLELIKEFVKELDNGQMLLNSAVDSGESLYPDITPENRENIRNNLRTLRDDYDNIHDEANSLLSQVESVLIQKTSIEESYSKVTQWLSESKTKVGDHIDLYPNLTEKKAALQKFKSQLQDTNLQKSALKQLQDKASSLSDEEAEQRVINSIKEYDNLNKVLGQRIATCDNHVVNHEAYDQILEKAQDWLTALKTEAIDILNEVTFEKEGAEEKLLVVENIILQKSEGDKIFDACHKQLQTVLEQTHPSGHPALINSFENQRKAWNEFINLCETSQTKLRQLCSKWDEFDNIIENLDQWLKQTEVIVKDQSLKSTYEAKNTHMEKLKNVNQQIAAKAPEFVKITDQGHEIEGETDLNLRVSRLNTRYQTLKNICKESISRYEIYTKEHSSFNNDYDKFKKCLDESIKDLENNREIVGDLEILQERQRKIRELSDRRINDSSKFETLIEQGEKLYAHTSPDGREIIRQKLRSLRASWDNLTDNLNSITQQLDQCLIQFKEFTQAQEQLTKWLKDIEKSMQSHMELKTTLQEKRAQLENHKLIHQEIMTHNALVDAVCDKAQELVDQTKDTSLNIYIQSIKQLFTNVVDKSQELLNNLIECTQIHQNYNIQYANLKNWLNGEMEKLLECDDTSGEKNEINKKLYNLEQLTKNREQGDILLGELMNHYESVKKSTSSMGIELLDKELGEIQSSFNNHFNEIANIEAKQKSVLQQWHSFEKNLDELSKWCRTSESIFRDQQLQSNIDDKIDHLNKFKNQREEILQKQRIIDLFTDQANALLSNSGAERLKPLISQLSNRYQLLQVLSKEVVNRWQILCDDHRKYNNKLEEVLAWMGPVEVQLETALKEEYGSGSSSNVLQFLLNERDQAEALLSSLTTLGEKTLPETSTQGRERIRQELRDARDRWDKLDEGIRNLQKQQEAQTLQWSSYQDVLQQILLWLDSMENVIEQENPSTWISTQEIRSKLFKYKAILQEITSHKRVIETLNDKANALLQTNAVSNPDDIKNTMKNINDRYEQISTKCTELMSQLEEAIDVYQQFNELQKAQQDFQKSLWDRLSGCSDYSGSKIALQARLNKVNEIQDLLPEGTLKLQTLTKHIENKTSLIPNRSKEAMTRDLTNLNVDFDRFTSTLSDVKSTLENRLQQWNDYETNLDRLITLLSDAENSLKNYITKSTLEEKQEQYNKFQVIPN